VDYDDGVNKLLLCDSSILLTVEIYNESMPIDLRDVYEELSLWNIF
jgi:hypothetical protein